MTAEPAKSALFVDRLTKVYADGTHALDSLELRIPSGCFFGLLGPNGAGKTTLIGTAAGLVRAPAGKLYVFGHDAVTDLEARLLLGLAPQEVHLDRFLTAREVLVYHGRYFGLTRGDATGAPMSCSKSSISRQRRRPSRTASRAGCAAASRSRLGALPGGDGSVLLHAANESCARTGSSAMSEVLADDGWG